jgi:ABC-type proline/glycine betaine transport system permease subunit
LIIYYLIIILGSPTQDHDARSIWLFHAKRIYYDYNIYSQLDGYGEFSQNDYNPFAASLSASLAHLVNNWNEVLPKFSNLILTIPAILFLNFFFKNKLSKIFFFLSVLIIFDKRIVNGEMDAILALYLVSTFLSFFQFFLNKNLTFKLFVE